MLNTIDLFVGCGGLSEGFEQSRKYKMIGAVEWEPSPVKELRNHLKNRWGIQDSEERVLQFDIQRTEELFNGWKDKKFGESKGLDALVGNRQLDVIIGGPPCQAYSVAGRIRDEHGMREDYRNYLFESYLKVVQHYKPRVFVFENVPGILSAKPGDGSVRIIDLIQKAFADAGYAVLPDLSNAIIDMTEYGVPQNRKRIIILGVSKEHYGDKAEAMVEKFYSSYLPEYKIEKKATVRDAIGDLPKLRPLDDRIALVTAQISNKAQQSLRFLHVEAIGAIDAEAFMERIDVPVFSNNDNQKMLVAIKECISLAKGCEPTNEEVWKFCKAFILLLFDMDCAESVNRALSASLIKCNSPENPILVWSRLVEYAGQCNQAAASVSKENIDRNIRDLFSKNNIIQLPPDPITAIDLFIPTIALIGAWKEDNEFDRKMIEQISGMEYSEFEAKARTMLSQNSEYLQLMNGNWKVCHKEELLN